MVRKRGIFLIALFAFALMAFVAVAPESASADFRMCNKTGSHIGTVIGYKDRTGWKTEGWWNLPPNSCEALLTGDLVSRYYYVYAVDYDLGGEWGGQTFMCYEDKEFTIRGTGGCSERGYEMTGFFEIDTGDARSWTVRLTEPSQQGTGGK